MSPLSGNQYEDLMEVLVNAYPTRDHLGIMLRTRLNKNLAVISNGPNIRVDSFNVIGDAEAQGWTLQLINAVRESRPKNPLVIKFIQQFNLSSTDKSGQDLERIINDGIDFLDVASWRSNLGVAETRVCRIELLLNNGDRSYGTGFLIGSERDKLNKGNTILTNFHVIEPIINNKARAEDVVLRFDYKRSEDNITLNPGTPYKLKLDEDWLIASSPYSQADLKEADENNLPSEDELDFALLRVEGEPANDNVGKIFLDVDTEFPNRGYFDIEEPSVDLEPSEPLLILQHPDGDYLKLALDTNADLETNANNTRLRYKTNTLPGSSGSPCFNFNWKLVALHHAGDPNYSEFHKPEYNQGIPIDLIRAYILESLNN